MPANLVLRVEPNDDPMLSCWLCGGRSDHIPRPLMTTFYTPEGRKSVGLHQRCYDRAMTPIAPITMTPLRNVAPTNDETPLPPKE